MGLCLFCNTALNIVTLRLQGHLCLFSIVGPPFQRGCGGNADHDSLAGFEAQVNGEACHIYAVDWDGDGDADFMHLCQRGVSLEYSIFPRSIPFKKCRC